MDVSGGSKGDRPPCALVVAEKFVGYLTGHDCTLGLQGLWLTIEHVGPLLSVWCHFFCQTFGAESLCCFFFIELVHFVKRENFTVL